MVDTARLAKGTPTERNCSVARALQVLADAWCFLLIRETFFGARRFEEFRRALGIPRGTLVSRLRQLEEDGILRTQNYSETAVRNEYRLTKAGFDLYPTFIALMQFGDRWLLHADEQPPVKLVHKACGCHTRPIVSCSECLNPVNARSVEYRDGPGAGRTLASFNSRSRRKFDIALKGRPSSVSRTLDIIGDRWSFLIVRAAFFRVKRFDEFETQLGIPTSTLSQRLGYLVDRDILTKQKYHRARDRFEYLLTPMGMELYGPLISMLSWGDRWRSVQGRPLILRHLSCGSDFSPLILCDHCKGIIEIRGIEYEPSYDEASLTGLAGRKIKQTSSIVSEASFF